MAGGGSELQTSPTKSRRDGYLLAISMCLPFKLYHKSLYNWLCAESITQILLVIFGVELLNYDILKVLIVFVVAMFHS